MLIRRADLSVGLGAQTGVVTFIQRFGSALNPNVHLHMLVPDGPWTFVPDTLPSTLSCLSRWSGKLGPSHVADAGRRRRD